MNSINLLTKKQKLFTFVNRKAELINRKATVARGQECRSHHEFTRWGYGFIDDSERRIERIVVTIDKNLDAFDCYGLRSDDAQITDQDHVWYGREVGNFDFNLHVFPIT